MTDQADTVPADDMSLETVKQQIILLRGQKILLDANLATLYGVPTKRFNEQIKRNLMRFPSDFMFQLTDEEFIALRSQFATLKAGRGQHRKYLPYAFTEHGAIMASMILNSPRATDVSVHVVRAFVQLREMVSSNKELALRLDELESKSELMCLKHATLEEHTRLRFKLILQAIRALMAPPEPSKKRPIGFVIAEDAPSTPKSDHQTT